MCYNYLRNFKILFSKKTTGGKMKNKKLGRRKRRPVKKISASEIFKEGAKQAQALVEHLEQKRKLDPAKLREPVTI